MWISHKTSKHSCGDIKRNFDEPAGNYRQESENFLLKDWKGWKIINSSQINNLQNVPLDT